MKIKTTNQDNSRGRVFWAIESTKQHSKWVWRIAFAVCALISLTFTPVRADGNIFKDGKFDALSDQNATWEVRYGLKESEPDTRPRWRVVAATDSKSPEYGKHLYLKPFGEAAGTVYIGQRVRLPRSPRMIELSADYQTYCPLKNRSGQLAFFVMSVEQWDSIQRDPEKVRKLVKPDIMDQIFHPNKNDVSAWSWAVCDSVPLDKALRQNAGQEVVAGVSFVAWHPDSKEWMRLDNLRLGSPQARIEASAWPDKAYRGEPLILSAVASVPEDGVVAFRYLAEDSDKWQTAEATRTDFREYQAELPAAATEKPFKVQAAVITPDRKMEKTAVHEIKLNERPTHPSVMYTKAGLKAMRQKIKKYKWAKEAWANKKADADRAIRKNDETPPERGGGWSHDYTCPADGARLKFREDKPHAHLCPVCGKEWTDKKRDATWRGYMHGRFADRANNCSMAYQITGDGKYAREAIRILTWYADHYAGFEIGNGPAGRGRVHSQSLTEASWLTTIIEAADLAYPAMTSEEARNIENNLIRASVKQIMKYRDRFRIHNIACWHNAAMALAGYFLGDSDLIDSANEGRYGFKHQIDKGVLSDGMWFERSMGYHMYTTRALIYHVTAAMHAGDDLYKRGHLPKMFTMPLRLAFPDLTTPSFNDMNFSTKPLNMRNLELAAAWYDDETAKVALAKRLRDGASRANDTAWQWGKELPEGLDFQLPPSANLTGTGVAVLRSGKGEDALCAMIEHGHHGGTMHGHPDKLQLIFYGLRKQLLPDMGTVGYGNPMHKKWFKTTPSHNTVTIGGRNMRGVTGVCEGFEANDRYAAVTASTDKAYKGWRLTRRILLVDRFLVDDFIVKGSRPDIIDWFARAPGDLEVAVNLAEDDEKPLSPPYGYLKELKTGKTDKDWTAAWKQGNRNDAARLVVTMRGVPGTVVSTAKAPAPKGKRWENLRVRRRMDKTSFTCVYQVVEKGKKASAVTFEDGYLRIGKLRVSLPDSEKSLLSIEPGSGS